MDWSEKIFCLKCNEDGNMLICSGCPLAIHEECMGCPTSFDGAGNFYCPHCSFKQAVAELCQARKNLKLNRKALSIFMGIESKEHDGQNNESESERLRQSETNVIMSAGHDGKSRQRKNSLVNPFVQFNEEIRVAVKDTASMSTGLYSKRAHKSAAILNQSLILNKEDELTDAEGEKIQEEDQDPEHPEGETRKENYETYKTSTDKNTSVKMHVEQKLSSRDEDRIQEEDCGKSWAPTDGDLWPTMHVRDKRRIEMNNLPD